MTKRIHFRVTQDDIDTGRAQDCERCPVALAISRRLKTHVQVSSRTVNIYGADGYFQQDISLPPIASRFITAFDQNETLVRPFRFALNV